MNNKEKKAKILSKEERQAIYLEVLKKRDQLFRWLAEYDREVTYSDKGF